MMMNKKNQGIQLFRLIAAVMVVAIHCFPFQDVSPRLDTLVTLTLFRVAVPFFFMVTGYFVLGKLGNGITFSKLCKVKKFWKKQFLLYGIVTLLFLPLSIYIGNIYLRQSWIDLLQKFLFDGTFYHLWYFPAVLLGVLLVTLLLKFISVEKVLIVTIFLYIIGVAGDSWYGIIAKVPMLKAFYQTLFQVFDYTRNGLFFTPLFLCLGILLYQRKVSPYQSVKIHSGLLLALAALLGESFLLHHFEFVRHDSMYVALPFVMWFLFQEVLHWEPKKVFKNAQTLSLLIYILHPLVIVVVHFAGKLVPFLRNSLLNFMVVLIGSYLLGILLISVKNQLENHKISTPYLRASKDLSVSSLQHNVDSIQNAIPATTKIMGIVKADGYGCDGIVCSKYLEQIGIDFFGVATLEEGVALREAGVEGQILILGYTSPSEIKRIKKYDLIQSIISEDHAAAFQAEKIKISCHIKVDTGMHRLGVAPTLQTVKKIYDSPYLEVKGIFSHLGSSDTLDEISRERTLRQIQVFDQLLADLRNASVMVGDTHLQSSYGVMNYPELIYDYVRVGIILYGMRSTNAETKIKLDLQPVIQLKAKLIAIKNVSVGEYLGYGTDTLLKRNSKIGVVSIGYADGIPRGLSNQDFQLYFHGQYIPQIGRICMDMLLVDLTDLPDLSLESNLTVMDHFEGVATQTKTITNEIVSRIGKRIQLNLKK